MKKLFGLIYLLMLIGCSINSSSTPNTLYQALTQTYLNGFKDGIECTKFHNQDYCQTITMNKLQTAFDNYKGE